MKETRAQKSKILAIVLALLLGGLGVHNFYMGHNTLGLAKIALNAFGIAMSLLAVGQALLFIAGLWVILEAIMIAFGLGNMKTDRHDVPLKW